MATSTIFDDPVVQVYDPKKIPGWVARTPTTQTNKVAGQSLSVAPTGVAVTLAGSVALATPVNQATRVEGDAHAPIVEVANPVRLEPSLPAQPQPAKSGVNVLVQAVDVQRPAVDVQSQAVDEQRPAVDVPSQRPQ